MPTQEEIKLFRLGGHNAESLAAQMLAQRLGIHVGEARRLLVEAAR